MDWKRIIDFIFTYWREIVSCGALFITVLVNIFRKRPSYNGIAEIKEDVLEILPTLICKVETNGNGQLKKEAVINLIKKYVLKKYGIEVPSSMLEVFDTSIEGILSAPQKKAR